MTDQGRKYLYDILSAINKIEDFTMGVTSYGAYCSDSKTMSAVERQLGIIEEATNKFSVDQPQIKLKHTSRIVSFRNRIIHSYDNVDSTIVWNIINNHLPELKVEITYLLQ